MGRMDVTLEVCVDTEDGLRQAVAGGADRIELCAALGLGGLTPSGGFMRAAAGCGVAVMAMIRPRAGDFVFSAGEEAQMAEDVTLARAAGLAGVVLGASLPDGRLDRAMLARLVAVARGMDLTLHRCFDLVPDMGQALDEAVELGFSRVLTAGGAMTAMEGIDRLIALQARAAGRIGVMPGAGIRPANAGRFAALGFRELHGSCAREVAVAGPAVALGFGPAVERRTSADEVKALRAAFG
jgi:copper homeostasis protein